MRVRDIFKISRKTFLNPGGWIYYDGLKEQTITIWGVLKNLFTPTRPVLEETFEQAIARLKLTKKDVANTAKTYHVYALIFAGLGLFALLYAFYLLFRFGTIAGWLLSIAVSAFLFAQAFRFDFWSLQMRERKLGLTFADWKNSILGKKGSS